MFGQGKCNASGNRLISFLNEVELVVCNDREFTVEPQRTRARPSLKQKSIIDYSYGFQLVAGFRECAGRHREYRKIGSLSGMDGIG